MSAIENTFPESPFFPIGSFMRCADLLVRQAFGTARIIADAQGLYHVLLIGAGCTAMLPMAWASRAQARMICDGLNLLTRHEHAVRVEYDRISRRFSTRFLAGIEASQDEIRRMLATIASLNGTTVHVQYAGNAPRN